MKKEDFVKKYLPFARITQDKTGIKRLAILVQAALESGWGEHAPGNMFFGVKDGDGLNGNEQLLRTVEYSRRRDLKFPVIISVTPVTKNGLPYFRYVVKDHFRKYDTPEQSFTDHANFFLRNKRYAGALESKSDPYLFLEKIWIAGYATDPDYYKKCVTVGKQIEKIMREIEKSPLS